MWRGGGSETLAPRTDGWTSNSSDEEEPDDIESSREAQPGTVQAAPLQPSPPESLMLSAHMDSASTAIGDAEAYGAPPRRGAPSEHDKTQPTSAGCESAVQAASDKMFVCRSASETSLGVRSAASTCRPALRGRVGRLVMRSSALWNERGWMSLTSRFGVVGW